MRLAASIAVLLISAAGCGRGEPSGFRLRLDQLEQLERLDGNVWTQHESGPGPRDIGPWPFDGDIPEPRDTGVSVDCYQPNDCWSKLGAPSCSFGRGEWACNPAGNFCEALCPEPECWEPRDCERFGPPGCPGGRPGRWDCVDNGCLVQCMPPPPRCRTDCDCPFELSCADGACMPLNRPNLCCFNPRCRPGAECVLPDGQRSFCEGPWDAGVPDAGRYDAGHYDAGRPDAARPDATPRDTGVRDTGVRDTGVRDGGVPPPPDAGVQTPVGATCSGPMGWCGPSGFCIEEDYGFPGGYCSQECGRGGRPCPAGATCRRVGEPGGGGPEAVCLDVCESPADCRHGYNCTLLGVGNERVCWPIPPGSTNPMGAPVGGACNIDDDCYTSLTCLDEQSGFRDGYCSKLFCDPLTNPCPAGTSCYAFPGLFSACLAQCPSGGSQSTCRSGYYCLGPTGQPGVCIGR